MAKWDFLLLKFIKVDVLQGFSCQRDPAETIKSRNFRQKILPLNKKCLYLQSVLHEEATPVMKHQDGSVAQLDRATAF